MANVDLNLLQIGVRVALLLAVMGVAIFGIVGVLRYCADALTPRPRVVVRNPRKLPLR